MASLTVNPDYKLYRQQYQTDAYQIAGIAAKPGKSD